MEKMSSEFLSETKIWRQNSCEFYAETSDIKIEKAKLEWEFEMRNEKWEVKVGTICIGNNSCFVTQAIGHFLYLLLA